MLSNLSTPFRAPVKLLRSSALGLNFNGLCKSSVQHASQKRVLRTTVLASREVVSTKEAPGAVGPYSQAIKAGTFVFVSGQVGLVPGGVQSSTYFFAASISTALCTTVKTAHKPFATALRAKGGKRETQDHTALLQTKNLAGEDVDAQAEQVMKNLGAVLDASGSSFRKVVKTTVLLTTMGDFQAVNAIYGRYFPEDPPARACFAVKELPLGAKVEIEAVATS